MRYQIVISAFLAFCFACELSAFRDVPACYADLELNFFKPEAVAQALSLHYVYQSQWNPVITALKSRSPNIPRIINERARRMNPNPLDYPFDPKVAKQLLLQVTYEIFADVMRERNFSVQYDIRGMFNYIAEQQIRQLDACFETTLNKKMP